MSWDIFFWQRKNKIVVTEFSLGMGPRLLSTVKNGTRYSLKLFPIGGSCAMMGEDMEDEAPGTFNNSACMGAESPQLRQDLCSTLSWHL